MVNLPSSNTDLTVLQLCWKKSAHYLSLQNKFHGMVASPFVALARCCLFSSIFQCASFFLCHTTFALTLTCCASLCLSLMIMPLPLQWTPQSTHLSRPSSNATSSMMPPTIFPVAIDLYHLCAAIVPITLCRRIFIGKCICIIFSLTMYPHVASHRNGG